MLDEPQPMNGSTILCTIIDRSLTVRVMSIGRGTVEPFIKVLTKLDVKEL
jgi:hypothetical protein